MVKFQRPSAEQQAKAVGDLTGLSLVETRAFNSASPLFRPVPLPHSSDWLACQTEKGQSFDVWKKWTHPTPHGKFRGIRIVPFGDFPEGMSPPLSILTEFCSAFFPTMNIVVQKPVPVEKAGAKERINPMSGRQILAPDLQSFLGKVSKEHARDTFCVLGITVVDLYPREEWNFVFGLASTLDLTGVFSFARYSPVFPDEPRPLTPPEMEVMVKCSCMVLVHEVTHMFGLKHCIYYDCVMNGSNHLEESKRRSRLLCPVCLRKMTDSTGWDVLERENGLLAFYEKYSWDAEAAWTRRRISDLQGVTVSADEPAERHASGAAAAAAAGAE